MTCDLSQYVSNIPHLNCKVIISTQNKLHADNNIGQTHAIFKYLYFKNYIK